MSITESRPGEAALNENSYQYGWITGRCAEHINQIMAEARRHTGHQYQYRVERAYGAYMGWRALVMDSTDPVRFANDDREMEALLKQN